MPLTQGKLHTCTVRAPDSRHTAILWMTLGKLLFFSQIYYLSVLVLWRHLKPGGPCYGHT